MQAAWGCHGGEEIYIVAYCNEFCESSPEIIEADVLLKSERKQKEQLRTVIFLRLKVLKKTREYDNQPCKKRADSSKTP